MKRNNKIIKVVFRHYKKEGEEERLNEAFDLLFEEILKMNEKQLSLN